MFETPFPEITEAPATAPAPMPPLPEIASEVVDRAQIVNGTPLVKYSATEAGLLALKAELAGKVYDLKTTKGDQAARADRLRCVTLRTTLERKRKDFKAPALAYGKLIDTEAARITAEIEALEAPIDAQIKADEQRRAAIKAEQERIEREAAEKHAARRAAISMYASRCREAGMTAERIAAGMQRLEVADMADPDPARAAELAELQGKTLETMRTLHAQSLAREQEAARQEAIRVENERVAAELAAERQRIADEAAEIRRQAAELEAQRAESARLEALAVANRERLAREAAEAEQRRAEQAAMTHPNGAPMYGQHIKENGDRVMLDDQGKRSIFCDVDEGAAAPTIYSHIPWSAPVFTESADFGVVAIDAAPAADLLAREAQIHTAATQAMQAEAQLIDSAATLPPAEPAQAQPDEPADVKMGTICRELGFNITEEFVRETLGVTPTCRDKRAILFTATQRRQILLALVRHVQALIK